MGSCPLRKHPAVSHAKRYPEASPCRRRNDIRNRLRNCRRRNGQLIDWLNSHSGRANKRFITIDRDRKSAIIIADLSQTRQIRASPVLLCNGDGMSDGVGSMD